MRAKGTGRHRRRHARPRHRRQRGDLQRRPRRAAAPARQSRRGSPDLHPPERAGHRRREHDLLGAGNQRLLKSRVTTISAFGDFSTVDFTMIGLGGEPRMVKAGVVGGSFFDVMGLRPVLGRLLNAQRRWPEGGGRGGAHLPLLDDVAQQRSVRDRQDDPSRSAHRDRRRRPRAVGPVSGRHRDHRERRDQPAPPRRDDGDQPHAPHDRAVRPPRARRVARRGARRADRRACRDDAASTRTPIRRRPTSSSRSRGCAIRLRRRRGRSCWCCWPPPPWCS